MTAAVKVKDADNKTGVLNVKYVNNTQLRQCNADDFNRTNMLPSFLDLTAIVNNYYCPENYKNVTLAV